MYTRFQIETEVSQNEVTQHLYNVGAWKAPGEDLLPSGFLKACGKPFTEVMAVLATRSLELAYFPRRFRSGHVIVLPKPGKTARQKETAGGWRPITLLSTTGKLLETIIGKRITYAAEEQRLLPQGQMGNRAERSTELAIRMVVDAAHTAWDRNAVATLLQLDIKGAFDTVNHRKLLHTLWAMGFPIWIVRWVRSFLADRTARLSFDGDTSEALRVCAGVPQGSPLSPILFLLYIASLYNALAAYPELLVIGFADDTNIMTFDRDPSANCRRLAHAWRICSEWAESRGMEFAPQKSELMHLTRAHAPCTQRVNLHAGDTQRTRIWGLGLAQAHRGIR